MLTAKMITELMLQLNDYLKEDGEMGEVGIIGGAVMCLVYNARQATRDVDAIFKPTQVIRRLVEKIGKDTGLGPNWLNDAAKGYVQGEFRKDSVLHLSNLRIWAPEPRYMLAMKCLSARWDTWDRDDVTFLIRHLKFNQPKDVFDVIEAFYPKRLIPPKTKFFIEELFQQMKPLP